MNLVKLLFFKDSRKVGFGLWLFVVANIYLVKHFITSQDWFTVIALCSALIGGGTLGDKILDNQKKKLEGITSPDATPKQPGQ